ncbi:MAG: hypothetical protein KGQ54_00790 [Verrucomicrobia bacterium]|nr:hypothetical protein [Verrucomicrobiota bacterium]NDE62740.1 hypothetical protein [Chlamydiota bacterium]
MKSLFLSLLCVFSELFNPDPDLKAAKNISAKVLNSYPQLEGRGVGKEEDWIYVQFQTKKEIDFQNAKKLTESVVCFILNHSGETKKAVKGCLIYKDANDGDFYQIPLDSKEIKAIKL